MKKIKIIIVDDEKLIRDGLKVILSSYDDIEVNDVFSNGREAYEYCKTNDVDVVLMDIRMEVCDGVLGTKLIKSLNKDIKVLMLTTFNDGKYIKDALSFGASGYLLKDSSYDLIHGGIKAAYDGNIVVHPDVASKLIVNENEDKIENIDGLNEKETKIVKLIAEGLSNKEISEKLFLSEGTVKNNISTILSKLSLRDRTQIAIFAFKNNMV